jgi:hypothetical protein
MGKAVDSAREVQVGVPKSQADAAAPATVRLTAECGRFALCGIGEHEHDAAPFPFLELQGVVRSFIRQENGNWVVFQSNRTGYFGVHVRILS